MGLLGSPVHDSSEALVSRPGPTRWTAPPGQRNSNDQRVDPALTPPPSQLDTAVKPTPPLLSECQASDYESRPVAIPSRSLAMRSATSSIVGALCFHLIEIIE